MDRLDPDSEIALLTMAEAQGLPFSASFRQSRLAHGVITLVLTVLFGGFLGAWAAGVMGPEAGFFWWAGFLAIALFLRLAWGSYRAACGPANWVMRIADDALLVKFRSFLNHRFPAKDPVVARIPFRAVKGVSMYGARRVLPDSEGAMVRVDWSRSLDIELRPGVDTEPLREAVRHERQSWEPALMGKKRSNHFPIQVAGDHVVRIAWRGAQDRVVPRVDAALDALIGRVDVRRRPKIENQERLDRASTEVQENALIDLVRRGDKITAVRTARALYGMGLAEAKRFVEELDGNAP